MLENAAKVALDPIFPPPPWPKSKLHLLPDYSDNKFELVFNEATQAAELKNLPIGSKALLPKLNISLDESMIGIIEEEEMEDDGSDEEYEDMV